MNCPTAGLPNYDLRDYYFEGLGPEESRQVREHLTRCEECASEIERLDLVALSLGALPEEEIPRRIAFVSDKVFEPSPVLRWWQGLWLSGARMATVAALALAVAILVHAYRPTRVIQVVERPANVTATSADPAMMQASIDKAVAKAVAEAEARYDVKVMRVIAENEKQKRAAMNRVAEVFDAMDRTDRVMTVADNRPTGSIR